MKIKIKIKVLAQCVLCFFSIISTINVGIGPIYLLQINESLVLKKMLFVLSLVPVSKQQFNELINGTYQEINIKNRTYYFFNDIINIEDFVPSLLKIEKTLYKNIGIYYIGYIIVKKTDGYENIYSVNLLYLVIGKGNGFIEEKIESKHFVFDSTDENKKVLKKIHRTLGCN